MMGVKDMLPTPNFGAANPLFRNPAEALPSPLDAWRRRLAASAKEPEALVYGMLTEPASAARHFSALRGDGFSAAAAAADHVADVHWAKISSTAKAQLVWLLSQLAANRAAGAERLALALLRRVESADVSAAALWLGDNLRELLLRQKSWLLAPNTADHLVPVVLLAHLRLAAEWSGADAMAARRDAALGLCAELWAARPQACKALGRELPLALWPLRAEARIAGAWRDVVDSEAAARRAGAPTLLATPTPKAYVESRVSPDDARRLRELLEGKSRADGFSTRDAEYDPLARDPSAAALDGFAAARLRGRGGAARLSYDLLRWMVVCVHPPNAQLKLGLVQRWELAAALIAAGAEGEATPPASPTAAMDDDAPSAAAAPPVALALVVELLGHAKGETVMHVEPAALLLARAAAAPPARHAGARRSAEAVFAALRSAIDGGLGGLAPPDALGDAVGRALRHARQLRVVSTLDPVRQLALSLGARLPIDGMSQALAEAVALVTSDGIETLLARASAAPPQPEAAATSTGGTVDLGQFGSAVELQALGMDALKAELTRRGMKCGGTLKQRAERLYLCKSTAFAWKKHLAKPPRAAAAGAAGASGDAKAQVSPLLLPVDECRARLAGEEGDSDGADGEGDDDDDDAPGPESQPGLVYCAGAGFNSGAAPPDRLLLAAKAAMKAARAHDDPEHGAAPPAANPTPVVPSARAAAARAAERGRKARKPE